MQVIPKRFIQAVSLLTFIFLFGSAAFSQSKNTSLSKVYLQAGGGPTSHGGFFSDIGIQAVLKNNWTTSLSYHSIDIEPKNIPSDFDPGYVTVLFIPIPNEAPSTDMKVVSFMIGKYYKGGRNTWFTTEAGLSFVNGKELNFSKRTGDPSYNIIIFGEKFSNYTYTEEKKSSLGAMLKADFNWAFSSFAGLGAGVFANFNSLQSPVGFQLKLIIGKMNKEKKR